MTENAENKDLEFEPQTPQGHAEKSGPAAFRDHIKAVEDADVNLSEFIAEASAAAESRIAELEAQVAETKDQLIRTIAEMENLRKRSVREREDAGKYAVSSFAKELLDVADTFRRALDAIPADLRTDEKINPLVEGIEATERAFLKAFEKNGIVKIEPMNEVFNPNFHEVMFEAPVPGKPSGIIIQLIEPGYLLHDRLLRPARVGVSKAEAGEGQAHHVDTSA